MAVDLLIASLTDARREGDEAFASMAGLFGDLARALREAGEPVFHEPESVPAFERAASGALLAEDLQAFARMLESGELGSDRQASRIRPLCHATGAETDVAVVAVVPGPSPTAAVEVDAPPLRVILAGEPLRAALTALAGELEVGLGSDGRPDGRSLDAVLTRDPESDRERARLALVELLDALSCSREAGSALLLWPSPS